jgi:hypothetical protein
MTRMHTLNATFNYHVLRVLDETATPNSWNGTYTHGFDQLFSIYCVCIYGIL